MPVDAILQRLGDGLGALGTQNVFASIVTSSWIASEIADAHCNFQGAIAINGYSVDASAAVAKPEAGLGYRLASGTIGRSIESVEEIQRVRIKRFEVERDGGLGERINTIGAPKLAVVGSNGLNNHGQHNHQEQTGRGEEVHDRLDRHQQRSCVEELERSGRMMDSGG